VQIRAYQSVFAIGKLVGQLALGFIEKLRAAPLVTFSPKPVSAE
jgi:hypothetical protein